MSIYSKHADDGFVHEDRYVPSGFLPTLAASIGADQHQDWVKKLAELVKDEDPHMKIVIGTTGGLRKAIGEGKVQLTQVKAFEAALEAEFNGRARLEQLTGSEEAELELIAVQYIARHALPGLRPVFGGGTKYNEDVGVLSSGGASSQVAYFPHQPDEDAASNKPIHPKFLSLNTNLLDAMEAARKNGRLSALAQTEDSLWKNIAAAGAPLGKLRGTFVVIELAGSIGKEAGLADRLVPKREAVQLLTQHLESIQRLAGKDLKTMMAAEREGKIKPGRRAESIGFFQEARAPLTLIALGLLDLFSPTSWFFCATSFQVGSEENVLRAQWPLGFFLKDASIMGRAAPATPRSAPLEGPVALETVDTTHGTPKLRAKL